MPINIRRPLAALALARNNRALYEQQAQKDYYSMMEDEASARKLSAEATGLEGVNRWRAGANPQALALKMVEGMPEGQAKQAALRQWEALMPGVIQLAKDANDLTQSPININRAAGGQLQLENYGRNDPLAMFEAGQIAEGKPSNRFSANEAGVLDVGTGGFNLHELGRAKVATEGAQQGAYGSASAANRALEKQRQYITDSGKVIDISGESPRVALNAGQPSAAEYVLQVARTAGVPTPVAENVISYQNTGVVPSSQTPTSRAAVDAVIRAQQVLQAQGGQGTEAALKATGALPETSTSDPGFVQAMRDFFGTDVLGIDHDAAAAFLAWSHKNGYNPERGKQEMAMAYSAWVQSGGRPLKSSARLSDEDLAAAVEAAGSRP